MYKLILVSFCFCLITFKVFSQTNKKELITVKAEITGLLSTVNDTLNGAFWKSYFIRMSITNNQDTTIKFWVRNCPWDISFLTDSDSMSIFSTRIGCDALIPEKITLLPKQQVIFYATINDYSKVADTRFKIGFVMLDFGELMNLEYYKKSFKKYLKSKKVYWSEDIVMKSNFGLYHVEPVQ